jgi:hypothetical protein
VSVGVSTTDDSTGLQDLVGAADMAMYAVKNETVPGSG